MAEWREQITWIPQRPYLFSTTIAANIRLARPLASMAEVIAAAEQAGLHDFITTLPLGYDTLIDEQGTRLSGGQRQRLAIARAILKNAPIFILDEPTSHLDPTAETSILATLATLLHNRTALIIAHNRHTINLADQIITIAEGSIKTPVPIF